jgi:N-hydroxyarylamine O-acetyltransferase
MDLDAYLGRLGLAGRPPATLATLATLHLAHATTVPFENLDIQLGLPVRLDLPSLMEKLVRRRRGGYCFEQNSLFAAALEALGFRVTRLLARVTMGRKEPTPRTHLVLLVDTEAGQRLADVGFGSGGMLEPMPLHGGVERSQHGWRYRLDRQDDRWQLSLHGPEGWQDLYVFSLDPVYGIDIEVANHYTSTHPASRFVTTLTAQRVTREVRYLLRDRDLEEIRPTRRDRRVLASRAELDEVLAGLFGLELPPGAPLANPRFP